MWIINLSNVGFLVNVCKQKLKDRTTTIFVDSVDDQNKIVQIPLTYCNGYVGHWQISNLSHMECPRNPKFSQKQRNYLFSSVDCNKLQIKLNREIAKDEFSQKFRDCSIFRSFKFNLEQPQANLITWTTSSITQISIGPRGGVLIGYLGLSHRLN